MPEGPEVANLIKSLQDKVVGRTIVGSEVLHPKITMPIKRVRQSMLLFSHRLQEARILELKQRGKYLVFTCKSEDKKVYILSHLGMTGAFFIVKNNDEIPDKYRRHIHLKFYLDDGNCLAYADIRRFGWVGVLSIKEFENYMPIQNIGPNPMEIEEADDFIHNIRETPQSHFAIKRLLMKPNIIAGVGNIYACETLFRAKVHPLTKATELSDEELANLYVHIRNTLLEALECGGSSISDYMDSKGESGSFQDKHQVYRKKACYSCLGEIQNICIEGRSSFFCPKCQIGG